MKRTTSFHLESDILKEISDYQQEYRLSSKNIALERMLLERRYLMKINSSENVETMPVRAENKKIFIESSLESVLEHMPD